MPEKQGWSGSLGGDLGVGGRGEEEERNTNERGTSAHREKRLVRRKTCDDAVPLASRKSEKPDPS